MESYGTYKTVDARSSADKRATSILESTIKCFVQMILSNNFFSALVQLKSLEKRLSKDYSRLRYQKTIFDLEKGYVIQVEARDPKARVNREWYLPHHPVINSNKPGKIRRVLKEAFNFHGFSLNKSLLVGPDLWQRLLYVLLHFRQHKIAVFADIEGMFFQVGVCPDDQPSLRFPWCEDPSTERMLYQYTHQVFEAPDSLTCKNFVLQQTAKDNDSNEPTAAAAVCKKNFMYDFFDSLPNAEQAVNLSRELVKK